MSVITRQTGQVRIPVSVLSRTITPLEERDMLRRMTRVDIRQPGISSTVDSYLSAVRSAATEILTLPYEVLAAIERDPINAQRMNEKTFNEMMAFLSGNIKGYVDRALVSRYKRNLAESYTAAEWKALARPPSGDSEAYERFVLLENSFDSITNGRTRYPLLKILLEPQGMLTKIYDRTHDSEEGAIEARRSNLAERAALSELCVPFQEEILTKVHAALLARK